MLAIENGIYPQTGKRSSIVKRGIIFLKRNTDEEIDNTKVEDHYLEKQELKIFLDRAKRNG